MRLLEEISAIINRHLANHFPERLIGLHSNMILASPPSNTERRAEITEEEENAVIGQTGIHDE